MTTIMAKRVPVRVAPAPAALLALLLAPYAQADTHFTPTLEVKETYTDNVALAAPDKARAQFVSEITPGFTVENNAPRLKLRGNYQLHYYTFSDNDIVGTQRAQSQLQADMRAILVDELLFLDGAASIGQAPISAFGPPVNTGGYTDTNRANVKTWRIAPTMRHRFGATATGELRYSHDYVDAGNTGLGRTQSDNIGLNLASGISFRKLGWNASLSRQKLDDNRAPESTVDNANLGLRYAVLNELNLTSSVGYDSYDYQSVSGKTKGKSYTAGFAWTPSSRSSLSASAGKRYYGSTYAFNAVHRSRHTVWSISYNDAVTTTRASFLLPSTVNTASMLDKLFAANIPDPAQRAAAVAAYIALTGLPPALADSVNYFSNRYILQKSFQASVAFNSARTTTVVALADTRRNALSSISVDSALQGSSNANINDDVHQQSLSLNWSWRMGARSTLTAAAAAAHNVSETTGQSENNRNFRLGLTREFHSRLHGNVELRRIAGTRFDLGNNNYTENAISASLSMKL
jgi:uncharacterized protein (PEP-CTERM system associated)